jgi:luciferase family oxidoreductase group 1
MISLSVLDQSPVRSGGTPADSFAETVRLAQAAERLGYRRYWLAEHHGSEDFAGSAPEIMITRVAAATSTIRVGSGGVMLSHYSPFKVAETFRVLETMYPGRIDLGIGRAPGADHITSVALAYGSPIGVEYFPTKIADLTAFLTGGKPATEALAPVHVNPRADTVPEIWLLGSSDESARYAAHFGLSFSFAQFISPLGGEAVVDAYRRDFRPSPLLAAPRASIGVFVICADTEAEARRLGRSRDLWRLRIDRGERKPYPSVEEAEAYPYTPQELAHIERNRRRSFFGAPEQVKAHLTELAAQFGVEELVILTITHDPAARLRSYELLAQAFGLTPRG